MTDLKPCPFCGATLHVNNARLAAHPRFSDCLLAQQVIVVDSPTQVSGWNTRAEYDRAGGGVDEAVDAERDALTGALKHVETLHSLVGGEARAIAIRTSSRAAADSNMRAMRAIKRADGEGSGNG